jgi:dCTP deaminase
MVLSDRDLRKEVEAGSLVVEGLSPEGIRENAIDLTIGGTYATSTSFNLLDPCNEEQVLVAFKKKEIEDTLVKGLTVDSLRINTHQHLLIATEEYLKLPNYLIGTIALRSSWARFGLMIPYTIIDAGFEGNITLGVYNQAGRPIVLRPGQRFCSVVFQYTSTPVENPYSGQYNGQKEVRPPKALTPTG